MFASALVYASAAVAVIGVLAGVRPIPLLWLPTRTRGLIVAAGALACGVLGLLLPTQETRVVRGTTHLDEFAPVWQFNEVHTMRIAAPPARVFEAIGQVRADDILLFRTLTWIRRGGRALPPGILNAGADQPLIQVATNGGFVLLVHAPPREVLLGAVVRAPAGRRSKPTAAFFKAPLPPGFAVATMNFVVTPDGPHASIVSTETRVFAGDAAVRRRFAAYWRVIYPGSALIRRMWLRAIDRRARGVRPGSDQGQTGVRRGSDTCLTLSPPVSVR